MSCKKLSISMHHDLHAGASLQAQLRGYESFSSYVVALLRLDAINDTVNDHALAQRIADMGGKKRDRIDGQIRQKAEDATTCWAPVAESVEEVVPALFKQPEPIPFPQQPASTTTRRALP